MKLCGLPRRSSVVPESGDCFLSSGYLRRASAELFFGLRSAHEGERASNVLLQIPPMNDSIEKSVLEEKFTSLEALGQLLANRLLDNTRSGEADQGSGFSDVQIAQHGE